MWAMESLHGMARAYGELYTWSGKWVREVMCTWSGMWVRVAMESWVKVWRMALTKEREGYAGRSFTHKSLT